MNKKMFDAMSDLMQAEIGDMPHQSKANIFDELVEKGYAQKCFKLIDGRPPLVIEGYGFTMLGHRIYCEAC